MCFFDLSSPHLTYKQHCIHYWPYRSQASLWCCFGLHLKIKFQFKVALKVCGLPLCLALWTRAMTVVWLKLFWVEILTQMCVYIPQSFKGHYVVLDYKLKLRMLILYNTNGELMQSRIIIVSKNCFQRKLSSPEYCLKLERWQGPPHMNKVKQHKLCCPLRSVCLFSLFSHENKDSLNIEFVYAEKNQPMKIFLFSLKLHSTPLIRIQLDMHKVVLPSVRCQV